MYHNFTSIHSTDEQTIVETLRNLGRTKLHCTNGTYAYEAARIVPTMLAGFKFIDDKIAAPTDSYLIAVNSNVSMKNIMDQKNASGAERAALEDQLVRAMKVAGPIAELFPQKDIVAVFYDKSTPTDLYNALADAGFEMESLFKWGYGTDPTAPKIEGADRFKRVLAYPLPNDVKPVCFDLTPREDQSGIIQVAKLAEIPGPHGAPYISKQGKVLFDVPASLASHAERAVTVTPPTPAKPQMP